ncbi:lysocardiolipin acyltransferase 1-like [Pieris brassicae]|uniref:lysocardiolipin acyltransferase 1-like n=1 Tax=Pieris brassicae TaxID=7116 RepID=UPI001E65F42E|nr:lysocardiolipin acyltransferase 1-like [Pieris brassicae]
MPADMAAGPIICGAWYFTILAGFYILYCPVMYLMFINHHLYRKIVDLLFALWELYPVALFQWCYGTKLHHYGDYVNPNETTIIVMNHRTRVDWNYVWIALYHATQSNYPECICKEPAIMEEANFFDTVAGGKSRIKIVLKDEIKSVPGMGWIMQLNFFLYVKRNWQEDQVNMSQYVEYYKKLRYRQRVVLFPEGTDLSEDNKRRSEKYALTKQLPVYDYVLHPRTTGWSTLCSSLRPAGLVSVYDVTVAYDTPAQTELDLLRGNVPRHVYFYFKRYAIEELPSEEEALRTWLMNRWTEKNACLQKFHTDGVISDMTTNRPVAERIPRSLTAAKVGFIFWSIIDIFFFYSLCYSIMFRFWVLYHTLLFILVTKYCDGFQKVQYRLLNRL